MLKKILFATDLGPFTHQVLEHAVSIAEQNQASAHLLHVVDPISALTHNLMWRKGRDVPINYAAQMNAGIRDRVLEMLENEFLDGHEGLSSIADVRVVTGLPPDTIISHAQHIAADLIVMGSHSHDVEACGKLGSVAGRVLQQSTVPVYLVPIMKSHSRHLMSN